MNLKQDLTKMALLSKSASLIFITALCFQFIMQLQPSDCKMDSDYFHVQETPYEVYSRKLLSTVESNKEVFKNDVGINGGKGMNIGAGWELREAPLGPDPLHHHGGSPKKPRIP